MQYGWGLNNNPGGGGSSSFTLVGAGSGRCLDVPGGNSTNGTEPIIWDCNGGNNQRWTLNGQALQSLGRCLDVPWGATAGTKVQIWDCNGGSNQHWNFNTDGTVSSVSSGLCLDALGNNTANATPVIVWTCTAAANQHRRWQGQGGGRGKPTQQFPGRVAVGGIGCGAPTTRQLRAAVDCRRPVHRVE